MALNVIYPGFKAFKALESRSLKDSQAMLLYRQSRKKEHEARSAGCSSLRLTHCPALLPTLPYASLLLLVCVTCFLNALKEVANAVLGTYANLALWKLIVLAISCVPLLIVTPPAQTAVHIIVARTWSIGAQRAIDRLVVIDSVLCGECRVLIVCSTCS